MSGTNNYSSIKVNVEAKNSIIAHVNTTVSTERMTSSYKAKVVFLVVVVTMVTSGVQSRYSRAKREKRGCCPPSFTGTYYRKSPDNLGSELTFYFDLENERFSEDFHGQRSVVDRDFGCMVNDKMNCIQYSWFISSDEDTKSYMCLASDASHQGQQTVQLADGETKLVDVYEMKVANFRITKYYTPDDTNCIPIGEKWTWGTGKINEYTLLNFEIGKPVESKFAVPEKICRQ